MPLARRMTWPLCSPPRRGTRSSLASPFSSSPSPTTRRARSWTSACSATAAPWPRWSTSARPLTCIASRLCRMRAPRWPRSWRTPSAALSTSGSSARRGARRRSARRGSSLRLPRGPGGSWQRPPRPPPSPWSEARLRRPDAHRHDPRRRRVASAALILVTAVVGVARPSGDESFFSHRSGGVCRQPLRRVIFRNSAVGSIIARRLAVRPGV
mmetsp:Transcript_103564/g.299586  ORF Transcript_103564/g.299586 Transcript_103564/m.299586 type:complete len:212 (-) Transcript_103564:429-1064(-)